MEQCTCQSRAWKLSTGIVLVWEGVAAATKYLRKRGAVPFELPYITEIIRSLPRPLRCAAGVLVGAAMIDHFDTERVLGRYCRKCR